MKNYLKKLMGLFFLIFRILVDLFRMTSSAAAAAAAVLCAPTHEEILEGMDSSIRDYLDQSSDRFVQEYGRTKMRLTPQALKDEKKRRAQERVVSDEKKKVENLKMFGLTSFWIFYSEIDRSGDRNEVYEKLYGSFVRSCTKYKKKKNDPLREYQPLSQIREGFLSTGEGEAIVASLNQMLDEIYALCITEFETKIKSEEEKLSQMM